MGKFKKTFLLSLGGAYVNISNCRTNSNLERKIKIKKSGDLTMLQKGNSSKETVVEPP